MSEHDDIYFAVFLRTGASDSDILYDGSVRRLPEEQEIYYFFDDLTYDGVIYSFPDFIIREVTLTGDNIVADKDGNVSGYDDVIPIENGGTLSIGGTPVGGTHQEGYAYTVSCVTGESTGRNENVRTDTVTNSRPGIALYKADRSGEWKDGKLEGALAGAVFTLKEQADGSEDGRDVAAESYTSREDGLITIAYLNAGTYVLNEIATPRGYVALDNPIVITVEMDGSFRVEGATRWQIFMPSIKNWKPTILTS